MAATPEQGERDLKTLVTSFPQSPRVNDALLHLAQIEMGRGDRQTALQNLGALTQRTQSAGGPVYAKAALYTARIRLDSGDTTSACTEVTAQLSTATNGDPVLTNEYTQMNTLCTARAALASGAAAPDSNAAAAAGAPTPPTTQAGHARADTSVRARGGKPDSLSP